MKGDLWKFRVKGMAVLLCLAVAIGCASVAQSAPTVVDNFSDGTVGDSSIWVAVSDPHGFFSEKSDDNYMGVSATGNAAYTVADRSYMVSQLSFPSTFTGHAAMTFSNFSYSGGSLPPGQATYPGIGIGFTPGVGNRIFIQLAYTTLPGTSTFGEYFVFTWQNDPPGGPAGQPQRFFISADGITSGVLWVERAGDRINAGYAQSVDAEGNATGLIEFDRNTQAFLYSQHPAYKNSTQLALYAIAGTDGDGTLSAKINEVMYESRPVPLPPSLFLLAPGLFGLAAARRRFRK